MMKVSNKGNVIIKQWSSSPPLFSGVDISADEVYNLVDGVVIQVSNDYVGRHTIDVQFNRYVVIRYSNISKCNVNTNDRILSGKVIGIADRFVHVEYLTTTKVSPVYPVRIGKVTYYKDNPNSLLEGEISLERSGVYDIEVSVNNEYVPMKFSSLQNREFSNIGGETYVEF